MPPRFSRRRLLTVLGPGLLAAAATGCRPATRPAVGFAQIDSGGAWRLAETASLRQAAARDGRFELIVTDAQDQTAKQISDVEDLLARRVRAVFLAPREYDGLEAALEAAGHAAVPVFLIDRAAEGEPGVDYVTFIGSDFLSQGRRAAAWLADAVGGTANVLELTGTAGSSVARDRAEGFRQGLAGHPGVRVVVSQTAYFARSAGQEVTANVLQARRGDVDAVYAHNDEMALGAIRAVRAAGLRPGRDVTVVSIDGERAALEAILAGDLGASVESNPRFGPLAFAALEDHLTGRPVPPRIILADRLFDAANAADFLAEAY